MPDLEGRVRKLERTNQLLLTVVGLAGLVLALGGAARTSPTETFQCERLEVVDSEGRVRAVVGTDKEGSVGLFVHDPEGKVRVSVTHDPDQSALFIRDEEGAIRVGVAQFAHGGGGVALHGPDAKGAAVLYYKEGGSLIFFDKEGKQTLRIPEKKE